MAASVAQIWRHPIKGIGAEALSETRITRNLPLPLGVVGAKDPAHGATSELSTQLIAPKFHWVRREQFILIFENRPTHALWSLSRFSLEVAYRQRNFL